MKKYVSFILILILLIGSFYYADKVSNFIINKSPLMKTLKSNKDKYEIKSVDAIVSDEYIIPGIEVVIVYIKEFYPLVPAKPGQLALGVAAGLHFKLLNTFVERSLPRKIRVKLFVAYRLLRRSAQRLGKKGFCLVDKTGLKHKLHTQINAIIEHLPIVSVKAHRPQIERRRSLF